MHQPRIAFIAQPEYFRFTYEQALADAAQVRELALVPMRLANDFGPLLDFNADYNIFFRGEWVPAAVLQALTGTSIALSSEPFPRRIAGRWQWTLDSLDRYLHFRAIRQRPFDYVFHYDAASLPLFAADGLHCSGDFALPVALDVYHPAPATPEWDLFFIGRSSRHREAFFGPLKHAYRFLHICHGIWGAELVQYVRRAHICLNVHAEAEISWEPRVQMLLACGVLLISERITPNPVLRPGIDYVEVDSPRQMHEAVAHYLAHPQERERIAAAGAARVANLLDARACYLSLLDRIEAGDVPRFQPGQPARALAAAGRVHAQTLKLRAALARAGRRP
ncbi:glycosyltransferase [uncultured Thiohalocapsa sp.]|uniref:glycosyltransferase family protein n=1 Tax=uncultured Thiohalocapsa sp. TaxID=768990 RepID=UPI0025DA73D9|nr:glycosyltransferase [uncultured Thiohalocapsa sp.]